MTEALAAGLGFQTHAALRTSLEGEGGKHPAIAKASAMRFVGRLEELGYSKILPIAFETVLGVTVRDKAYTMSSGATGPQTISIMMDVSVLADP